MKHSSKIDEILFLFANLLFKGATTSTKEIVKKK
jgi:hypothetical protein